MNRKQVWTAGLLTMLLAAGCDNGNEIVEGKEADKGATQQFTLLVESIGESYLDDAAPAIETRRPVSSVTPKQTIDKLDLIIMRNDNSAEVVYHATLDGWSDTQNFVSQPYIDGVKQGRKTVITLTEGNLLDEGEDYLVYAVGYQSGTYGGYVPFKNVEVGQPFLSTETATVPDGGYADEIFAGSQILHVEDGEIKTAEDSYSELRNGTVTLRRQVAGTFGYFTHIPTEIGGKKVACLRLVATRRNKTVIFGGFRSMEDPENFNQENVINGMTPRTDYDARLDGSTENDAFLVYEVVLKNWFPGNAGNPELPLDANGDGYLDGDDTNWQVNEEKYPDGSIKLQKGSVFGDCFWVASAMYEEDIESGIPTFQMQLLGEGGEVLKSWDVLLREKVALQATRTVVTLADNGRTVVTTETNPETEHCFSIVRNHLYTMGTKARSQSYGEDEPIDLAEADVLVVDVENEWGGGDTVIFH